MATASFINVETFDLNGISAKMRLPVTAAPVPAGYAAYVDAVTLALFGSGLPGLAGVKSASIEIDLGAATRTPSGVMDVRNKWQATLNTAALAGSRLSIPGRNPLAALVTPGSEILAALLSSPWPAAFAALQGAAAIHLINPTTGDNISGWGPVVSTTRSRKRPRVGGSR